MSTFRQRNSGSDESAGESGDEDNLASRLLSARPKAVAKRRIPGALINDEQNGQRKEEVDKKTPSAGKLWAETAVMQTLEDRIGSGSSATIADLRDRGVESYALDLGKMKKFDLSKRKRSRQDDISDSLWDEQMDEKEEKPGPGSNESMKEVDQAEEEEIKDANKDPVADLWDGVDTGAAELPIEKQRKQYKQRPQWPHHQRGRGGNQFKRFKQQDQSGSAASSPGSNGGRGRGRGQWQQRGGRGGGRGGNAQRNLPPEKYLPRRLIAASYDEEKLFNTVLDPDELNEEELVKALVEALGEKEPALITKVVEFTGKQRAVEIFKECQEVERRGGMLTKKEDRRKAPGGVFLELFNQHEETTEEQKKAMFQLGSALMRERGTHPKWWDKREQKKKAAKAEVAMSL